MATPEPDALFQAAKKAFAAPFGAVLKLAPEQGPALWVDGRENPPRLSAEAPESDGACLWRGAREALVRAVAGARAFESAYVSGRISVAGDISVMARLDLDETR